MTIRQNYQPRQAPLPDQEQGILAVYLLIWRTPQDSLVLPIFYREIGTDLPESGTEYVITLPSAGRGTMRLQLRAAWWPGMSRAALLRAAWRARRVGDQSRWLALAFPDSGQRSPLFQGQRISSWDLELQDSSEAGSTERLFVIGDDREVRQVRNQARACEDVTCIPAAGLPPSLDVLHLTFAFSDWIELGGPLVGGVSCQQVTTDSLNQARDILSRATVPEQQRQELKSLLDLTALAIHVADAVTQLRVADALYEYYDTDGRGTRPVSREFSERRAALQACVDDMATGRAPGIRDAVKLLLVLIDPSNRPHAADPSDLDEQIRPLTVALRDIPHDDPSPFARRAHAVIDRYDEDMVKSFRPLFEVLRAFPLGRSYSAADSADAALESLANKRTWSCRPCTDTTTLVRGHYDSLRVSVEFARHELVLAPGESDTLPMVFRTRDNSPILSRRKVSVTVSNPAIVSRDGAIIRARQQGDAEIRLHLDDHDDTAKVRVLEPTGIRITLDRLELPEASSHGDTISIRQGEEHDIRAAAIAGADSVGCNVRHSETPADRQIASVEGTRLLGSQPGVATLGYACHNARRSLTFLVIP